MVRKINATNAAKAFAALGSKQRLQVMKKLVKAGPDGLTVGELRTSLGIAGSTLNHHLKTLVDAGLLLQERQGRTIHCAAVEFDYVEKLSNYLLEQCCADMAASKRHAS